MPRVAWTRTQSDPHLGDHALDAYVQYKRIPCNKGEPQCPNFPRIKLCASSGQTPTKNACLVRLQHNWCRIKLGPQFIWSLRPLQLRQDRSLAILRRWSSPSRITLAFQKHFMRRRRDTHCLCCPATRRSLDNGGGGYATGFCSDLWRVFGKQCVCMQRPLNLGCGSLAPLQRMPRTRTARAPRARPPLCRARRARRARQPYTNADRLSGIAVPNEEREAPLLCRNRPSRRHQSTGNCCGGMCYLLSANRPALRNTVNGLRV